MQDVFKPIPGPITCTARGDWEMGTCKKGSEVAGLTLAWYPARGERDAQLITNSVAHVHDVYTACVRTKFK